MGLDWVVDWVEQWFDEAILSWLLLHTFDLDSFDAELLFELGEVAEVVGHPLRRH